MREIDLPNIPLLLAAGEALKEGDKILNRHKYPVLDTEETDPEKFWDSLNKGKYFMSCGRRCYHDKFDIGSMAVHQGFMTPSTGWDCSKKKYSELSRRQKKIIAAVLKCKDEVYTIISIRGMCGSLFRI